MRQSIEYVQSGKIGKVSLARGLCYKPRGSIGKVQAPTSPPKTCDYDLWCGPAEMTPLMDEIYPAPKWRRILSPEKTIHSTKGTRVEALWVNYDPSKMRASQPCLEFD